MKKAADLRAYLLAQIPELKKHPDKLLTFIEKGATASRLSRTLSYSYSYTLTIGILDWKGMIDGVTVPLLAWIARNQSDLMHHPDKIAQVFSFQAEILDKQTSDITIEIPLTESVVVTKTAGGWDLQHLTEPPLPDLGGPTGWQLFIGDDDSPVLDTPLP